MIGETIGNFKILSRLGRGGMGEVFLAEHTGIQTKVAIKVLHEDISSDTDQVTRFFNEAKIVSRIKHAGIVKIFDSGMFKDHAYLILELLEGESLADRLEAKGRMSAGRLSEIGRQIASVLDATHRAGVTHRDLKPENIFLVTDDELESRERVKVLDFGIAKLHGTLASGSPRTVGTMGTPAYMAPEQWGDTSTVDWRADLYSLGCVAFEMACGRPPFDVKTIADACTKHLHMVPPRVRSLREDLPQPLDDLIARMLEKKPAARGESMAQIAAELEAFATTKRARTDPGVETRDAWSPTIVPSSNPRPTPVAAVSTVVLATVDARGSESAASKPTTLGASQGEMSGLDLLPPHAGRGRMLAIAAGVVAAGVAAVMLAVTHSGGGGGGTTATTATTATTVTTPVFAPAAMTTGSGSGSGSTATGSAAATETGSAAVTETVAGSAAGSAAETVAGSVTTAGSAAEPPPIVTHHKTRPTQSEAKRPPPITPITPPVTPQPVTPPPVKPAAGSGGELDNRT